MKTSNETIRLMIDGMTCINCQMKIEKELKKKKGISSVDVSYNDASAVIVYSKQELSVKEIIAIIEKLGYGASTEKNPRAAGAVKSIGILSVITVLFILFQSTGILNLLAPSRLADTQMGYGMLFVIGLITSVHCIAMCGGINLSQCLPQTGQKEAENNNRLAAFRPAVTYNLGRVLSYTAVGFTLGLVGFLIGGSASGGVSVLLQGTVKIAAGLFMIIMGINMLGIFPWLRKFTIRMPKFIALKIGKKKARSNRPFIVGILNGFMPCGPLQSMWIVALATEKPFSGAFAMFLFALGTVPLMLGLGSIVTALGKKFTDKVMTVGAILVVVLGLAMLFQGGTLAGWFPANFLQVQQETEAEAELSDGVQVINSTLSAGCYPSITVQAGVSVKWIIDAPEGSITGCNYQMFIPDYDIQYTFQPGENIIEFTPTETGTVGYSCWMGMIYGSITVIDGAESDEAIGDNTSEDIGTSGGSCCI